MHKAHQRWTANARTRLMRDIMQGLSYEDISLKTGRSVSSLTNQVFKIRRGEVEYTPPKDVAEYIAGFKPRTRAVKKPSRLWFIRWFMGFGKQA
mgnify:FL=1